VIPKAKTFDFTQKNAVLSRLSILIITYNRQAYALRNMHYWADLPVEVHVLDGSSNSILDSELCDFPRNINYYHLPISVWDRLSYGANLVSTDFTVLMGDDEFYIPSALEACIHELLNQPDLVACIGRALAFNCTEGSTKGFPIYPDFENYHISQENPIDRMIYHMNPYSCSTIYAVTRSFAWKSAMKIVSQREFAPFNLGELQYELSICYQGKSKVIPHLMWLRSYENIPIRDLDETQNKPENYFVERWWLNQKNKLQHNEFLECMTNGLSKTNNDRIIIRTGLIDAINAYVAERSCMLTKSQKFVQLLSLFISKNLKKYLKKYLKIFRNRIAQHIRPVSTPASLLSVANQLKDDNVTVDLEQLIEINKIILNFHARN